LSAGGAAINTAKSVRPPRMTDWGNRRGGELGKKKDHWGKQIRKTDKKSCHKLSTKVLSEMERGEVKGRVEFSIINNSLVEDGN